MHRSPTTPLGDLGPACEHHVVRSTATRSQKSGRHKRYDSVSAMARRSAATPHLADHRRRRRHGSRVKKDDFAAISTSDSQPLHHGKDLGRAHPHPAASRSTPKAASCGKTARRSPTSSLAAARPGPLRPADGLPLRLRPHHRHTSPLREAPPDRPEVNATDHERRKDAGVCMSLRSSWL